MTEESYVSYHFEQELLAGIEIGVRNLRCVEALDEPYRLDLELVVRDPDVDLSILLGKDCVLEMARDADVRRVCGLVRHIEEQEHSTEAQACALVVVPALWMMGLRRNTKIFQEMTVPEILEAVLADSLGPYGREHRLELTQDYPRREYCVQYQETDLAFVHRMMEEHGIHYAFDHEGDKEVIVLRDANSSFAALPSGSLVPYQPDNLRFTGPPPILRFQRRHHETTTSVVVRDWDWTKSGDMRVEAEERGEGAQGRDRESYEQGEGRSLQLWDYSAGARAYQQADADRQALVRQQEHVRDVIVGHAVSSVVQAAPGATFELSGHPMPGFDGEYLITWVEHVYGPIGQVIGGAGDTDTYYNRLRCIPLDTEHRATRRTKKPRVSGIQTAVVTGPSGEEIHVDEHGRIKVQFHWDRDGQLDENSSCWIRVQQPWAGPEWGFWYVPRIGMEVVVHFVDGDPDRPLVTGCVYNGTNLPPYPLPDEKTKSTIKSNSSIGGGGSNEFRFEDKSGSEEIYTHAEKDYNEVVENDHTTEVNHDQTITVDNDQTQVVKNNQTEMVHNDQTMTVEGNRTVHVKGNYDETVDGTETRNVVGDVTESFAANETRTVGGDLTETIGGNETRTISASQTETITGDHTLSVTGNMTHTITGALTNTVVGGITQETPATYTVTAVGGLTVLAPAGVELMGAGGIMIGAPGGVMHVDSEWDWLGMMKYGAAGYKQEAFALKNEATGVAFGVSGIKIEINPLRCTAAGAKLVADKCAVWTGLTYLKNGAFQIEQGPLDIEL